MCQQTEMGLHIEQLYLQGMPRKIGKSVENTLLKRKSCIKCNPKNNGIDEDNNENISIINTLMTTTMTTTMMKNSGNNGCTCMKRINENSRQMKMTKDDILAIITKWTRIILQKINNLNDTIQKSKTYKTISRTTQPAHVIALGILSFVLLAVWPNLLESDAERNHKKINSEGERKSALALLTYLAAFATHFGAQIWMTFVSGLSLYFALPRHTFGLCQQILFPKYFAMNSVLSICTLIMFIKVIGGRWEFSSYVQVIALTICAVIEVTVRLYLAPPLLRLMREKHKFEISVGSGQEIGHLEQKDLIDCPHYQKIHKSFRRIHMTVAMGNITALVCTFLHLHYLASKISVS